LLYSGEQPGRDLETVAIPLEAQPALWEKPWPLLFSGRNPTMKIVPLRRFLLAILLVTPVLVAAPRVPALSAPVVGGLDCNNDSSIQRTVKQVQVCADPRGAYGRGYDNGHYVGHDEPSIGFNSDRPGSGNDVHWLIKLPVERPLPATQTLENMIAFWFSMAVCDPKSYPQNPCTPDSDKNHAAETDPKDAGSAFLELQFYPPGNPPFITNISCDYKHWCAALNIDSLECNFGFKTCNPQCEEPANFAFIQTDGVPIGPPGPASQTAATYTPTGHTLSMNQGDVIAVTIKDTPAGLLTRLDDLTTGRFGFMVASAANGFQNTNPSTCAGTNFSFHPEFDTAKFGNFVPWAGLQADVNVAIETGHFQPGANGDGDSDDAPCFSVAVTVPGCLGADVDFDGTSYLPDWADGTKNTAKPLQIGSILEHSFGPVSNLKGYPTMQFETDIGASESTCQNTGAGCTVPPPGAAFYPFYALSRNCIMTFGNDIDGSTIYDFGRDAEYGTPNLPWFFGTNSGGIRRNPCPGSP
jgi:hypothetical protein